MGRADFQVYLQNQRVKAGSKLLGAVYLDVKKKIKGSRVVVRLDAFEKSLVKIETGDWSKRSSVPHKLRPVVKGTQMAIEAAMSICGGEKMDTAAKCTQVKKESRKLLSIELPVGTHDMIENHRIAPGHYKLPFEIDLDENLPCSFWINQSEGECGVYYELEAQLCGSGFFKDYKDSLEVYVHAKPIDDNQVAVPFEGPPAVQPIHVRPLCCTKVGEMIYGCQVSNTVVGCGQEIDVNVACINNSAMDVMNVVASVKTYVAWNAQGFSHQHRDFLVTKSFGTWKELNRLTKQELKDRKAIMESEKKSSEASTVLSEQEGHKIYATLKGENHKLTVQIPFNAIPTYKGPLIHVRHVLRIKFVSPLLFNKLAPFPRVEIPLQVFDASDKDLGLPPIIPPDWVEEGALMVADAVIAGPDQMTLGDNEANVLTTGEPSSDLLLTHLGESANAEALIGQKIHDPSWKPVMETINPETFGSVLRAIPLDFRKLVVAIVLAKVSRNMTCLHAVAALRASPDWMRASMVRHLLPYCVDLVLNKAQLLAELTDWEKTVTEYEFAAAHEQTLHPSTHEEFDV